MLDELDQTQALLKGATNKNIMARLLFLNAFLYLALIMSPHIPTEPIPPCTSFSTYMDIDCHTPQGGQGSAAKQLSMWWL